LLALRPAADSHSNIVLPRGDTIMTEFLHPLLLPIIIVAWLIAVIACALGD
jgi:hypothetical protein